MLTRYLNESKDSLWSGNIRVRTRPGIKVAEFRKKLKKYLGIPNDTCDYTIARHHFKHSVLRYWDSNTCYFTTPISKAIVINNGLNDCVESYSNGKNLYMFVANNSYNNVMQHLDISDPSIHLNHVNVLIEGGKWY